MKVGFLACGGWISSAIAAAAELRIADHLEAAPQTAVALARTTGASHAILERLLRALAVLDVFHEDEHGRFSNTPDSRELLSTHPHSMRHYCMMAGGLYQRAFEHLMHSLRTGEPATMKAFGQSLYAYMDRAPAEADVYDRSMEDLARASAAALAASRDFSRARIVVDVGGGRGAVLKSVLSRHPHLRGICVDRASVCERAAADLAATDSALARRLEYRPGDFLESLPPGDVYILKNVLQNWNDETACRILQRVREAAGERADATVMVLEGLRGGTMPDLYQRMDDFVQVVICEQGTTARTEAEFRRLFDRAGLRMIGASPLQSGQTLLEATPKRMHAMARGSSTA